MAIATQQERFYAEAHGLRICIASFLPLSCSFALLRAHFSSVCQLLSVFGFISARSQMPLQGHMDPGRGISCSFHTLSRGGITPKGGWASSAPAHSLLHKCLVENPVNLHHCASPIHAPPCLGEPICVALGPWGTSLVTLDASSNHRVI